MVLILKNVNDGTIFFLLGKQQFTVGRKNCDFLIQDDQSISRKHAVVHLKGNNVTVEDCGSKYHTTYKNDKLQPNTEVQLILGDSIHFGVSHSLYKLEKYLPVTTGTRLSSSIKTKLLNDLSVLDGKYVDHWTSDCTHLTVQEITLTIKFLHALVDEKPVVKPTYWSKFVECVQKNLPPPQITDYNNPPVAEMLLNKIDLAPNPQRKSLFKGKVFIFPMEKDRKPLENIIQKVGGSSISWDTNPLSLEDIKASSKEFLIVQTKDVIENLNLNNVIKHFSKESKRTIPLQEIATAIVFCSCEKDCNPSFNRIQQVFPVAGPSDLSQCNPLTGNTESEYFTMGNIKAEVKQSNLIIPDTFESKLELPESCDVFPSISKIAEEVGTGQSVKRLHCDELKETPSKKAKIDKHNVEEQPVKNEQKENNFSENISIEKKEYEIPLDKQSESNGTSVVNPFILSKKTKKCVDLSVSSGNPFKSLKKQSGDVPQLSDGNPFKLLLGNRKRTHEDDIAELSMCKKKKEKDTISSSTKTEKVFPSTYNLSKSARVDKSVTNDFWMSKTTTKASIKIENEFGIDMIEFIEQFNNTVIVEVMNKVPLKPKNIKHFTNGDKCNGRMNFKTFKKVLPVNLQKKIIGRENFTVVDEGDTTKIYDNRRGHHNFENEAEETVKTKNKVPKKFLI